VWYVLDLFPQRES